jgi:hypothetical protein
MKPVVSFTIAAKKPTTLAAGLAVVSTAPATTAPTGVEPAPAGRSLTMLSDSDLGGEYHPEGPELVIPMAATENRFSKYKKRTQQILDGMDASDDEAQVPTKSAAHAPSTRQ